MQPVKIVTATTTQTASARSILASDTKPSWHAERYAKFGR